MVSYSLLGFVYIDTVFKVVDYYVGTLLLSLPLSVNQCEKESIFRV